MKNYRIRLHQCAVLLLAGFALAGYPCPTHAMSLFMGGDEPKQSVPPPKGVAGKPQPPAGQPGAKAAGPGVGVLQQTAPGKPIQSANVPVPVTAPVAVTPAQPAPAPSVAGQPSSAAASVSKPVGGQPPVQAMESVKETTKPVASAVTPVATVPSAQAVGSTKETPQPVTSATAPVATAPAPSAQAVASTKETPKPVTSATAPIAVTTSSSPEAEGYTYDPKSRRDPFQSLTRLVKIDRTRMELPPLQRVQLSDVKLLGIIWGGYGYYGLVKTPDGKGYTVKEGMLMGTNNGVISAITDKAVTVSEPSLDIAGNKSTKDIVILLRPKEVS